jgi:23S rRNA pseudouridine1911/1915/1917 synthase
MPGGIKFTFNVDRKNTGRRLDEFLTSKIPECSRSYAAKLTRGGFVSVNRDPKKPSYKLKYAETVEAFVPPPEPVDLKPNALDLNILYEDQDLVVLNKQAGLVVHPAPGNPDNTLVNGLLHHCPDIEGIGGELRPGIVHRLDKDTSGCIIVAKNNFSHSFLSEQFKTRTILKEYLAVVHGHMRNAAGVIELPIGRHPVDRKKMSVKGSKMRSAVTKWKVKELYENSSLIHIHLKTGRTHQIRVHFSASGHPVLGDSVYGKKKSILLSENNGKIARKISIERQMLHAFKIGFIHPRSEKFLVFEAPLAEDMMSIIKILQDGEGLAG